MFFIKLTKAMGLFLYLGKKVKTHIVAFILFFISTTVIAQQNFEGKIIYIMTSGESQKNFLEANFSKQKIKITVQKINANSRKQEYLLDFENGFVYDIDSNEKRYKQKMFAGKEMYNKNLLVLFPEKNRKILGYSCTAYVIYDSTKSDFFPPSKSYVWLADSLYYPVKEEYLNSEILPMLTNGTSICMGAEMKMGEDSSETIKFVPISITSGTIPDSVFTIPEDYIAEVINGMPNPEIYREVESDSSIIAAVDSTVREFIQITDSIEKAQKLKKHLYKKSTHKKYPSKNTHNQPTKSAAIKPKQ